MKTSDPLIVERVYDASPETVWQALTDIEQIRKWYFNLAEFRAEEGFVFEFYGGAEDKQYLHHCVITAVVPQRKLSYSWTYVGEPGYSEVSFELLPENGKTRLRLTHTGLESFPHERDKNFGAASFTAGWNSILGESLQQYLANR